MADENPQQSVTPETSPAIQPAPTAQFPAEQTAQSDENQYAYSSQTTPPHDTISWTASEYIAHSKSAGWYGLLALVTLATATLIYFITGRDAITAGVILFAGFVFAFYAARKPLVQNYAITHQGVTIAQKTYNFSELKSFSVLEDGPFSSIVFVPMKRFMPALSLYFAPEDEDAIIATLSLYLPIEPANRDPIDRLMRKIRF